MRHLSRNSAWSSRRCSMTLVPKPSRAESPTVYPPDISLSHMNAPSVPRFLDTTRTLSATMNAA